MNLLCLHFQSSLNTLCRRQWIREIHYSTQFGFQSDLCPFLAPLLVSIPPSSVKASASSYLLAAKQAVVKSWCTGFFICQRRVRRWQDREHEEGYPVFDLHRSVNKNTKAVNRWTLSSGLKKLRLSRYNN